MNKNFEFGHLPELEEIEERALDLLTDPDILDQSAAIAILTRDLRIAGLDLKSSNALATRAVRRVVEDNR